MASDYSYVALFLFIGIAFVIVTMWFSWVVRPSNPSREKLSTYECGEIPVGPAWVQFRVGYYVFALIFVIFDVESVFLYPWAVVLKNLEQTLGLGLFAFGEMFIFLAILVMGLVYAWKKGALKWE